MIPAGRLRHLITIQQPSYLQDTETGEITETWVAVADEWAAIEGINGREFLQSSAEQAETTYRVTLRHRTLHPAWRIVSDGIIYSIEAILPNNIQSQLTVMCKTL